MSEEKTTRERRIELQIQSATAIDPPLGYEAIIKSYQFAAGCKEECFGYHFEKKGKYSVGDDITNLDGSPGKVEAIV